MMLPTTIPTGPRFRSLLLLLLLALGLLATVTLSQSRAAEQQQQRVSEVVLPAMKQLRELSTAVDESRGLLALHLLLRQADERAQVERRLLAARVAINDRMAAHARELVDELDRQHYAAVQASLLLYWQANDQLLAASRQALTGSAAADAARALMQGESQQAFARLRADIEHWWQHVEEAAAASSRQARASARWAGMAALVGLALAALPLLWLRLAPGRRRAAAARVAGLEGGEQADGASWRPPLRSLDAAVAAARHGEPAAVISPAAPRPLGQDQPVFTPH